MSAVGIINPGAMGISIAASLKSAGQDVGWCSARRSQASRQRAAEHGLRDLETLAKLCESCAVIICVCPPHAAESVAEAVIEAGFAGIYCDGNAIAPQKARSIGDKLASAGITFVDGSIIGPPAWQARTTRFYLSGPAADEIAALFAGTVTEAVVIGGQIGQASALKMAFAAGTKGATALVTAILGVAESLGVREDLEREWALRDPESVRQKQNQARNVTAKAWRFAGEMQEIAATFESAGIPPGFFVAAHELYERLAIFKDADDVPELEDVLGALVDDPD